jgi:hypothetical protein
MLAAGAGEAARPPGGTPIVLPSRNGRMLESLTAWRNFHSETPWSISAKAAISASTFFCGE